MPSTTTFKHTATSDAKFNLVFQDVWIRDANIHVITQDAKYGDFDTQDAILTTADVASFQDFNLKDLFFKNKTPGSNTTIQVVAIVMTEARQKALGV